MEFPQMHSTGDNTPESAEPADFQKNDIFSVLPIDFFRQMSYN